MLASIVTARFRAAIAHSSASFARLSPRAFPFSAFCVSSAGAFAPSGFIARGAIARSRMRACAKFERVRAVDDAARVQCVRPRSRGVPGCETSIRTKATHQNQIFTPKKSRPCAFYSRFYSQRAALRRKSLKISAFSATSARDAEYLSLI
jgi:hypothetical protein